MCVTRFSRVMRFCLLNVVTHDGKSLRNKRKAPRAAVALREEPESTHGRRKKFRLKAVVPNPRPPLLTKLGAS